MANANGRISKSNLAALPKAFSNKRETEHLTSGAYASLVRMMLRACADTGSYFSVWDAYRSLDEQVAMLKRNYTRVSRGRSKSSDRTWDGSTWAKRAGRPNTASPGYSNHGNGVAVDIHPGAIQQWLKGNAGRFGWVNDVPSEPWHWSYLNPGSDRYRSEGTPNVAGMQKALGVEADGKPGPGTANAVKAWQAKRGLTADGIPGSETVAAMLGKSVADVVEDVADKVSEIAPPVVLSIEEAGPAKNAYDARTYDGVDYQVKHATIHWWGEPSGQTFTGIRDYLIDNTRQVSAHYVVSGDRVARILPESRGAWGNGNRTANLEGIVIECDPNKVAETLPTLAALLADIFSRHGEIPVYPHDHWTSTECPGDYRAHIPALVAAASGGDPIAVAPVAPTPAPAKPAASGKLPTGKALLMAIIDAPDFPLLRTPGNLCYYGDDEQQTSVTGKVPNSLVPGEIFGSGKSSGAHGLKAWQKRAGIEADGRFGAGTRVKVCEVQKKAGLSVDGKLGPTTWYALWLVG